MTTLSMLAAPARSDEDASLRPLPWRRMAWVTWRQHRGRTDRLGAAVGRAGRVLLDRRPSAAPRLRRRDRLSPGRLNRLR